MMSSVLAEALEAMTAMKSTATKATKRRRGPAFIVGFLPSRILGLLPIEASLPKRCAGHYPILMTSVIIFRYPGTERMTPSDGGGHGLAATRSSKYPSFAHIRARGAG